MSSVPSKSGDKRSTVSFTILEREYVLACPEEEQQLLLDSVELLNQKISEVRKGGNVVGGEKIAVMAALHLAYQFIDYRTEKECYTEEMDGSVRSMLERVQAALASD